MCGIWIEDKIWDIAVIAGRAKIFLGTVAVEVDICKGIFEGLEKRILFFRIKHRREKIKVGGIGSCDSETFSFCTGPKAKSITFTINGGGNRNPKLILI